MKTTIAIVLSLLSTPALAQWVSPTVPDPAPPPVTYQQYGNRIYGSDGSTASTYGNQTYIQPANPSQPQVVCSTYGTVTTCQ
jgi:hypothetical protein